MRAADSRRDAGFTLVELLVALLVASLFMIGMLQILDTSTRLSKTESAVSDVQENVRYGAYAVLRAARMTGGSGLPYSTDTGLWVSGQVLNNQSSSISVDANGRSIEVAPGSDVLILRGFFEQAPFFTKPSGISLSQVTIQENPPNAHVQRNPMDAVATTNAFQNRLLAFMGQRTDNQQPGWWIGCVGNTGGTVTDSGGPEGRVLTLPYSGASRLGGFDALNAASSTLAGQDTPALHVYRVGVLESYVFYVSPQHELRRLRNNVGPASGVPDEVLAIDVGSLQVATGLDTDGDGEVDSWSNTPTAAALAPPNPPLAYRITVLGRTPFEVLDWNEPAGTFAVEDLPIAAVNRRAKWRRLQVVAMLRNFVL